MINQDIHHKKLGIDDSMLPPKWAISMIYFYLFVVLHWGFLYHSPHANLCTKTKACRTRNLHTTVVPLNDCTSCQNESILLTHFNVQKVGKVCLDSIHYMYSIPFLLITSFISHFYVKCTVFLIIVMCLYTVYCNIPITVCRGLCNVPYPAFFQTVIVSTVLYCCYSPFGTRWSIISTHKVSGTFSFMHSGICDPGSRNVHTISKYNNGFFCNRISCKNDNQWQWAFHFVVEQTGDGCDVLYMDIVLRVKTNFKLFTIDKW